MRDKNTRKISPAMKQLAKEAVEKAVGSFKFLQPHIQEIAKRSKKVQEIIDAHKNEGKMFVALPPRPATAQEINIILSKHLKSNQFKTILSDHEIFFDTQTRSLNRFLSDGSILTYKFKTGKRFQLFNELFFFGNYIQTAALAKELECPTTNAVMKMAEGINTQAKINLEIKEKIIEGREGLGYRINPNFTVHKK